MVNIRIFFLKNNHKKYIYKIKEMRRFYRKDEIGKTLYC